MIHPARRAVATLGVAVPVALAAAFASPALWPLGLAWLGVVAAALGIDAMALRSRDRLDVLPLCPTALHVGETETLRVRLRGERQADCEVLVDVSGPAAPLDAVKVAADETSADDTSADETPGEGAPFVDVPFRIRTERRGTVRLTAVWLRSTGPLGLARRTERRAIDIGIAVMPNTVAVKRDALRFASADAPLGAKPQHQKGSGSEFEALRDYAAGLDIRAIDWKHSARHRRLVCKEFQTERNHHVMLALDTGHLMAERVDGVTKLDRACTALLLLGYVSLKAGDRVGLCAFDAGTRAFLAPAGGMAALARWQRAMAGLDYRMEETNFTLAVTELAGRLTRRSLVIIATDFVDTVTAELMVANLGHLARRHLVVFGAVAERALARHVAAAIDGMEDASRAVVAHDLLRERRTVFARLARLGVLCVEAPAERLGPELINRYLAIKTRDLI